MKLIKSLFNAIVRRGIFVSNIKFETQLNNLKLENMFLFLQKRALFEIWNKYSRFPNCIFTQLSFVTNIYNK